MSFKLIFENQEMIELADLSPHSSVASQNLAVSMLYSDRYLPYDAD